MMQISHIRQHLTNCSDDDFRSFLMNSMAAALDDDLTSMRG